MTRQRLRSPLLIGALLLLPACAAPGLGAQPPWWQPPPKTPAYERLSGNLVHVLSPVANDLLGRCVKLNGEAVDGGVYCVPSVENLALGKDLNHEGFRSYSQVLEVNSTATVTASGAAGQNKTKIQSFRVVLEWARWRTQRVTSLATDGQPFISAIEVGVAVRLNLKVTVTQSDVEFRGSFGFADLAAAIAVGGVQVEASIRDHGLVNSILPETSPTQLNKVDDFIKAVTTFYTAVREVAVAYQAYVAPPETTPGATPAALTSSATTPEPPSPAPIAPLVPVKKLTQASQPFASKLPILAYFVSDLPDSKGGHYGFVLGYLSGINEIANGGSCGDYFLNPDRGAASQDYTFGFLRAYSDFGGTSVCGYALPSESAQAKARAQQAITTMVK